MSDQQAFHKGLPILIECEGSGHMSNNYHEWEPELGLCKMCGQLVPLEKTVYNGYSGVYTAIQHKRDDVLARLERGDFDG